MIAKSGRKYVNAVVSSGVRTAAVSIVVNDVSAAVRSPRHGVMLVVTGVGTTAAIATVMVGTGMATGVTATAMVTDATDTGTADILGA